MAKYITYSLVILAIYKNNKEKKNNNQNSTNNRDVRVHIEINITFYLK